MIVYTCSQLVLCGLLPAGASDLEVIMNRIKPACHQNNGSYGDGDGEESYTWYFFNSIYKATVCIWV